MARDEDWLALEFAAQASPFRRQAIPESPFDERDNEPDLGLDTIGGYVPPGVRRHPAMAPEGKGEPGYLQKGLHWLNSWLAKPGLQPQRAGDQLMGEGEASSHASGIPRAAMNMAWSDIPRALLHSAEHYAGWQNAGMGEFDPGAVLVPPNPAMLPGMTRIIAKGEASPFSTWDRIRAKWDDTPPVPFIGRLTEPAVWAEEVVAGQPGRAWPHHQNPFSPESQRLQQRLEEVGSPHQWPRPPKADGIQDVGAYYQPGNVVEVNPRGPPKGDFEMPRAANDSDRLMVVRAEAGNEGLAALSGHPLARQSRAPPFTAADVMKEAQKLGLTAKRNASQSTSSEYVKVADPRRPDMQPVTVRVADHKGYPNAMPGNADKLYLDAGPSTGATAKNMAGEKYNKSLQAVRDALAATFTRDLVPYGAGPTYWRWPKNEPRQTQVAGTEPPNPAQPRLSESVGELWAKTDNPTIAALARQSGLAEDVSGYHGARRPYEGKYNPKKSQYDAFFMSEEPGVANNVARHDGGHVYPVKLAKGTKVFDSGNPAHTEALARAIDENPHLATGSLMGKQSLMDTARKAPGELIETFPGVTAWLRKAGFDGWKFADTATHVPGDRTSYGLWRRGHVTSTMSGETLFAKSGDRFTAAVAAMKLDPDKAKAVSKALENMSGLDDSQIAGVLQRSYGVDPSVSMPALMRNPQITRRDAGRSTPSANREAREKAELTDRFWAAWDKHAGRQVDVAKELGVTQASVSRWANPKSPQHLPRSAPQSAEAAAAEAGRRNLYGAEGLSKPEYDARRYQARKEEMARQYRERRGEPSPNWGGHREGAGRPPMPSIATKPGTATPVGPLVEGIVEKAGQEMRTAPEMARRPEGVRKSLWDEHGKKAAADEDRAAAQRAMDWIKRMNRGGE